MPDSQQSLCLLNTEMSLRRNAFLQNKTVLNITAASQGGTYAIIQTECCMFIPNKSAKVSSLLSHMMTQVNTLRDLTLNPGSGT